MIKQFYRLEIDADELKYAVPDLLDWLGAQYANIEPIDGSYAWIVCTTYFTEAELNDFLATELIKEIGE